MHNTLSPSIRLAGLVAGALLPLAAGGPAALGADFFISSQADFDAYRGATFAPGDNILFERGKSFTGMFAPKTAGAAGNVITISAYGEGNRPVLNNQGVIHPHPTRSGATVSAGLLLFNSEYVEVSDLEITNNNGGNQSADLFGIYVLGEDTGKIHNHIYLNNNYVHHINGGVAGKKRGGIHVHGYSPTSSRATTYNDVRIVNNVIDQIGGVGIGTDIDDADIEDAQDFQGDQRANAIKNLYVAHNWVGNTGRNSVIARDSDHAVYEYNTSANSSRHSTGNSFFNFKTIGLTFQYNEAYGNVGEPGDHDRGGFDADYKSKGTVIQYNYSHGNHWFASVMKKPLTDVTIRYNLSVNDLHGAYHYGFEGETDATDVKIYNNTHFFSRGITPELIGPNLERTPLNTTFNNNIFYSSGSGAAGANADNGQNVVYDTNVYFRITPPTSEVNPLTDNPRLAGPGAEPYDVDMEFGRHVLDGYRLAENSPYFGQGIVMPNNGGLDFWGVPVPADAAELGASQRAPVGGVPGDFNGDGAVDLADYTVWRDNLGAQEGGSVLAGNGSGGVVDQEDYTLWKNNFGTGPALLTGGVVPEPSPASLLLVGVAAAHWVLRLAKSPEAPQPGSR
ncbi:hypothetical protein Pla175_48640 [Pirellulimonas nuda]|uniref:Probable pectate lyase C n=1 Tax=Pirellulimonas nuda TaxID=2528009 RepID=A0A518DJ11_9BACT|nr:hypothetical protein [Pirellulimonas nuda]QDU91436.1 hypothetical protein Pla175_48640 [Pirellulimonas nuda]